MTDRSSCLATWVVVAGLVIGAGGLGRAVSAADCEIPAFLATGKTYHIGAGGGAEEVKVVDIDRQACWIKTADGAGGVYWVNLKQVFSIGEVRKPPTQAPSGQRRPGDARQPPTQAHPSQRR